MSAIQVILMFVGYFVVAGIVWGVIMRFDSIPVDDDFDTMIVSMGWPVVLFLAILFAAVAIPLRLGRWGVNKILYKGKEG